MRAKDFEILAASNFMLNIKFDRDRYCWSKKYSSSTDTLHVTDGQTLDQFNTISSPCDFS